MKFYKVLSVIVGILGFLAGIGAGIIYKVPAVKIYEEASFNWLLMLDVWFAAFLLVSIFVGISQILEYAELNYENINVVNRNLIEIGKELENKNEKSAK